MQKGKPLAAVTIRTVLFRHRTDIYHMWVLAEVRQALDRAVRSGCWQLHAVCVRAARGSAKTPPGSRIRKGSPYWRGAGRAGRRLRLSPITASRSRRRRAGDSSRPPLEKVRSSCKGLKIIVRTHLAYIAQLYNLRGFKFATRTTQSTHTLDLVPS